MQRGLYKEIARDAVITLLNDAIDRQRLKLCFNHISKLAEHLSIITADIEPMKFYFYNCHGDEILSQFTMTIEEAKIEAPITLLMDANDELYDIRYSQHPLLRDCRSTQLFSRDFKYYKNHIQYFIDRDADEGDFTVVIGKVRSGQLPIVTVLNQREIIYQQALKRYHDEGDFSDFTKLNRLKQEIEENYNRF